MKFKSQFNNLRGYVSAFKETLSDILKCKDLLQLKNKLKTHQLKILIENPREGLPLLWA